jgi:hypothetical protein
MRPASLAPAVLAAALGACTQAETVPLDPLDPFDPDTTVDPYLVGGDGTYFVQTTLSVDVALGRTTLGEYVDAPGATLIATAREAQVAALATLETALGAGTAAQLPAWFDEVLASNGYAMLTAYGLAYGVEHPPHGALVESELVIAGASAHHELTAIYFDTLNLEDRFDLGGNEDDVIAADMAATYQPTAKGGNVELGAHELAIAYGDYSFQLADSHDATMRQALGTLTACPAVAIAVANKCNGGCTLAIGLLTELCERGLDAVFAKSRRELNLIDIHFDAGAAALRDGDGDAQADNLASGFWRTDSSSHATVITSFNARRE